MNKKFEDIKHKLIELCKDKNIKYYDFLTYAIMSDWRMGLCIGEEYGDLERVRKGLIEDYDILADYQPTLEENEELAFAMQHSRDILDLLIYGDGK